LFAACTIISLPAYSWDYTGNYENIPPGDEDVSTIQTPAIIETVQVGGFTLDMDRVETGFYEEYTAFESSILESQLSFPATYTPFDISLSTEAGRRFASTHSRQSNLRIGPSWTILYLER